MTKPTLEFFFDGTPRTQIEDLPELKEFLLKVLEEEGAQLEVNCIFTTDAALQNLNRDYRQKDKTTDVLSFPWEDDEELLGEVYISMPQVLRQAPEFGATPKQEIQRVALHGILHLLGYDHENDADAQLMEELESRLLKGMGITDPYENKQTDRCNFGKN